MVNERGLEVNQVVLQKFCTRYKQDTISKIFAFELLPLACH